MTPLRRWDRAPTRHLELRLPVGEHDVRTTLRSHEHETLFVPRVARRMDETEEARYALTFSSWKIFLIRSSAAARCGPPAPVDLHECPASQAPVGAA